MNGTRDTTPAPRFRALARGAAQERAVVVFLAAGAVMVMVAMIGSPDVELAMLPLVTFIGGAAVIVGVRHRRPQHPAGWHLLGAGSLLFSAGAGCWFWYAAIQHGPVPYPGWPDLFFVPAFLCSIVGLVLMIRRRSPGRQTQTVLDSVVLAVGLAFANWVFLTGPGVGRAFTPGERVIGIAYPLFDVITVALVARLMLIGGKPSPSLYLLAAGIIATLAGDSMYAVLAHVDGLPLLLWMVTAVLLGAAALHPSMRQVATQVETPREGVTRLRLAFMVIGLQVPGVVVGVLLVTGQPIPVTALAITALIEGPLIGLSAAHLATVVRRLTLADGLTGLASRELLMDRLAKLRDRRLATQSIQGALLFVDLDHFKELNDTLGHKAGDEALVEVSRRLLGLVRGRDTVARLGGDEFVVLCQDLTSPSGAERVAERIVSSVAEPMTIRGQEVFLGASVGLRTLDGADPVIMLRDADTAMYVAKAAGRSRWRRFNSGMVDGLTERVSLDTDARHALARGQLRLVYQPIVSLADGSVVGVEALLRWRHPQRGDVPPVVTVPALERTGLINDVGGWAVAEALRMTAAWRAKHGGRRLTTSVNVSSLELTDPAYAARVLAALAATGTDPGDLCLELTESALIYDWAMLSGILLQLSRLGVRVALDDFGTGYSTLAQLAELPVQVIKIDKTFVAGLASRDGRHNAMATALIDMAAALRIDVVAEGVETPDQAKRLRALDCPHAQGYLFAHPMEAAELDNLLRLEQKGPAEHQPSSPQAGPLVHGLKVH